MREMFSDSNSGVSMMKSGLYRVLGAMVRFGLPHKTTMTSVGLLLLFVVGMFGCAQSNLPNQNPHVSSASNGPTPVSNTSRYHLTSEEMKTLILNKGIWNSYSGLQKYSTAEILRVGQFNEERKYWPVQVRVTWGNGGPDESRVWNCVIFKNDYGDWEVRKL